MNSRTEKKSQIGNIKRIINTYSFSHSELQSKNIFFDNEEQAKDKNLYLLYQSQKQNLINQNNFQSQILSQSSQDQEQPLTQNTKNQPLTTTQQHKIEQESLIIKRKTITNKTFLGIQLQGQSHIYREKRWGKTNFVLYNNRLTFIQISISFKDIDKIKILPGISQIRSQKLIKITNKHKYFLCTFSTDDRYNDLPIAFFIFAKIVTQEKMVKNISQKQQNTCEQSYIWTYIQKIKIFQIMEIKGLFSYQNQKNQKKHSFYISKSQIKYIWTRFDLINQFLIIKVKHGITKTQFGIPINNYSNSTPLNWLYQFCRMLP